jgi:hypothetical protein
VVLLFSTRAKKTVKRAQNKMARRVDTLSNAVGVKTVNVWAPQQAVGDLLELALQVVNAF